jgi:beta-lactamase regulating signal transducer with metallopeptidase domain
MIAALMLYSLAVTLLLAVAAAAAEQLLRLVRWPARFVWMIAIIAAVGLSVARIPAALSLPDTQTNTASQLTDLAAGRQPSSSVAATYSASVRKSATTISAPRFTARAIPIPASSSVARFDRPLAVAWAVLSIVCFGVITLSAVRLARANRRWTTMAIDGVPVLVSHDLGPAVIGILRYSIVLPQWSLELPAADREMILAHEREHARAGDPSMLFLSTLVVALMPWNAALWWIARRMRYAIELDCDARVLRHRDPRAYGALLLDVSERTMGGAVPLAAMAEPVSLIERRISAMTARIPRFAMLRASVAALVTTALVIVACTTPHPTLAPTVTTPPVPPTTETAAVVATDASPRTLMDARTNNAADEALRTVLHARQDSAALLLARIDSGEKILWSHGVRPTDDARSVAIAGGTGSGVATGGIGSDGGRLPMGGIGGSGRGRLPIFAAGVDLGQGYTSRRADRIVEIARQTAARLFPDAFQPHEGRFDFVTVVFDSTGAVVKTGRGTRLALAEDDRIADREELRATLPGVSIDSFSEWGMANLTTVGQSRGSGVMLLYAFRK